MGLFSPQIPTKTMVPLCRRLATSHDAGIPIMRSLELIAGRAKDRKATDVLLRMRDRIQRGSTLGEAAVAEKRYLPPFFIALLESGEHGGKLDIMLRDLADYFEDRLEIQREVTGAMVGPMIRVVLAWFLGTFALGLLPKIREALTSRTGTGFDLMGYINEYGNFQLKAMGVFAVIFFVCVILARMGLFRWISGAVGTFIWPLSMVTRRFALARFFRTMSLLLTSGLRVDQCIVQSAGVVSNPYIQRDLLQAVPRVRSGETLYEAFQVSRYLTPTAHEMLLVGEESGKLEDSLEKVSKYHLDEAAQAVRVATKFLTVALILAVAALIGYIVISFFLAYLAMIGDVMNGL